MTSLVKVVRGPDGNPGSPAPGAHPPDGMIRRCRYGGARSVPTSSDRDDADVAARCDGAGRPRRPPTFWSLLIITLDVFVIWAVAAHGRSMLDTV